MPNITKDTMHVLHTKPAKSTSYQTPTCIAEFLPKG